MPPNELADESCSRHHMRHFKPKRNMCTRRHRPCFSRIGAKKKAQLRAGLCNIESLKESSQTSANSCFDKNLPFALFSWFH